MLLLALTVAACGDDDDDTASPPSAASTADSSGAAATTDSSSSASTGTSSEATTASTVATSETTAPDDGGGAQAGGEITWLVYVPQTSFDPKMMSGGGSISQGQPYAVYDSLIRIDPDGTITPRLAESVTPDDDFSTWTIELRPDLVFTDDTPVGRGGGEVQLGPSRRPGHGVAVHLCRHRRSRRTAATATTLTSSLKEPNSQFPFLLDGCLGFIASPLR